MNHIQGSHIQGNIVEDLNNNTVILLLPLLMVGRSSLLNHITTITTLYLEFLKIVGKHLRYSYYQKIRLTALTMSTYNKYALILPFLETVSYPHQSLAHLILAMPLFLIPKLLVKET